MPLSCLRNVLPHDTGEDRPRGGQRPGLALLFAGQFGTAAARQVQAVASVTLASQVTGYEPGTCEEIDEWQTREAEALDGQAWIYDTIPAMVESFKPATGDDGETGAATYPAISAVAWHPDGDRIALAANFQADAGAYIGRTVARIWVYARSGVTWSLAWTRLYGSASAPTYCNALAFYRQNATYGALLAAVVHEIKAMNFSTGTEYPGSDCNGWSSEVIDLIVSGTNLYALFNGTSAGAATTVNGTTISSTHFRSGIMRFAIGGPNPSFTLTQERWGSDPSAGIPISASDDYYESDHRYLRFAEWSSTYPRGCYPTGMAEGPDGEIVVISTNAGWGPNWNAGAVAPSIPADDRPLVSVRKFDADGVLVWENDPFTLRDPYTGWWGGPYYNDIDLPTLLSVRVGGNGNVFVAGRRGEQGPDGSWVNVWKLRAGDGSIMRSARLHGSAKLTQFAAEGAMAIDPRDGGVWIGGTRSVDWQASPGVAGDGSSRHLWKLHPVSLAVMEKIDLGAAVSALGVETRASDGHVLYGTDPI